jgi:hypothetical protein
LDADSVSSQGRTLSLGQANLVKPIVPGWGSWIEAINLGFSPGAPLLEPLDTRPLLDIDLTMGYLAFGLFSRAITGIAAAIFFSRIPASVG